MEIPDCKYDDNELYHYGILGMKWGRRRYQTKDGSLTPAGQKRYDKAMNKIQTKERELSNKRAYIEQKNTIKEAKKKYKNEKKEYKDYKNKQSLEKKAAKEAKKEEKKAEVSKNKPISEMTNEELFAYKQRLQAEKDIYNLKSEISRLNPPPEVSGKKAIDFVKDFTMNELWGDIAKPTVKKFLDKKMGEEGNSELDKLRKEADLWKQKESISKSKYNVWGNSEKQNKGILPGEKVGKDNDENISDKPDNGTDKSNRSQSNNKKNQNKTQNESKQSGPTMSKAEKKAWKKVNDYNKNWWEKDAVRPVNDQYTKRLTAENIYSYEATGKDVVGKGSSRYTSRDIRPYIDADYREVVTNYPAVISRGSRSYNNVIAMLEDKRMTHSDDGLEYLIQNGLEKSINQSLDELYHYGIKGMKWGVYRFYNKDGTRTEAGKKRENKAKKDKRKIDTDVLKRGLSEIENRQLKTGKDYMAAKLKCQNNIVTDQRQGVIP